MTTKRVAFLVAQEGVEQVELVEPWQAVNASGHLPVLVSIERGTVHLFNHLDRADTRTADVAVGEASVEDYDALVLPGGVANPDALRTHRAAVDFVREFVESGRPVASICHAPWTLVEAGVLAGRRLTSWPSLRTDIVNAGGNWVDERLVVDSNLISSRKPQDLPAFCSALVEALEHGAAASPPRS